MSYPSKSLAHNGAGASVLGDLPEWFTEISPEQREEHEQLAERVLQLGRLVERLSLGRGDHERIAEMLSQALHLLDYTRPYNLSVVGMSGVGKSTLINALLGRDLLPSRHGLATTGTIVTVSQTVAEEGEPEVRRALIHYHTHQSLTELVQALCVRLNIEPSYTNHKPPFVHVAKSLQSIQNLVPCSSCQALNSQSAAYCQTCSVRLEALNRHNSNLPPELVMLEDLLQTAQHQKKRLEQVGPTIIPLNNLDDVRRVQALMDEESPTNHKGSTSRVIPLIRHIDYQLSTRRPPTGEGLAYINLTDTPGTAAMTVAHDAQLRRQLNPFDTDAIILVMKPHRPEAMIREMVPLIENLLMRGLKPEERHLVAERTFLVVNKGDEIAPEVQANAEQDVRRGVEKVGDKILTGFCGDHPDHVFYSVKAQPALIAELIRAYPAAAKIWLRGEVEPHFRFNAEYYLNVSHQAQRDFPDEEREEAILRWSQIRDLRSRLKIFLSQRWDQDLKKAQALYNNAHASAATIVEREWEAVTGHPFGVSPLSDLEAYNKGQVLRYAQGLRVQVQDVMERFRLACSDLHSQQRTTGHIDPDLEAVRNEIQRKIAHYTDTIPFRRALMSMVEHPIFGNLLDHPGVPQPLVRLDTLIYEWIDNQVGGVALVMMDKLDQALERAGVETALQDAYYQLPIYNRYLTAYQKKIIGELQTHYEHACRGAMLYQMMTRRVVEEIRQDEGFRAAATLQSSPQGEDSPYSYAMAPHSSDVAERLIIQIRDKYTIAHQDLFGTMPTYLTALFFYHLNDAEKKLQLLVDELLAQLGIDIGNIDGPLYQRIQTSESSQAARRARLYDYWKELEALR